MVKKYPTSRKPRKFKPRRKFVRKAKMYKTPRSTSGDTTDSLKITMHRTLYKKDFSTTTSDQSMFHDILFNVAMNLNATQPFVNGTSNLLYHPDASRLFGLYQKYKCSCVVIKFARPDIPISYNNTNFGISQNIQKHTIPWGTKVLHTTLDYARDGAPLSGMESNANLTVRQVTNHPSSWREGVDDGKRLFKNHFYKRSVTRVWKPVNSYERRWIDTTVGNQELVRGGIHIRFQKDHGVDLADRTSSASNFNINDDVALMNLEATIYMRYKDRA